MMNPTKKSSKLDASKSGQEDPTEFIDASASEHSVGTGDRVAVAVASPENNYIQYAPKRRCWRFLVLGLIVAVGCGFVAGFYMKTQGQEEEPSTNGASGPMACAEDLQRCADETFVARDPLHNCEFHPCPPSGIANQEAMGGDPQLQEQVLTQPMVPPSGIANEQAMFAEGDQAREEDGSCKRETKICTDLSTVTRMAANDCQFQACPEGACMTDTKRCPDNSTVGRDPENKCEFKACPEIGPPSCGIGYQPFSAEWSFGCQPCPPGTYKASLGPESCSPCEAGNVQPLQGQGACNLCETGTLANADTQSCDGEASAQGSSCPPGINPREIKLCGDLSAVTRNGPDCKFAPCP